LLLLTTTSLKTLLDHWNHPEHGRLLTPRHYWRASETARDGIPWAIDNDGFGGVDPDAFRTMVYDLVGTPGCLFLNAPDVYLGDGVEAHTATLEAWREWNPFLRMTGFPLAFVLQIGATPNNVPWDECEAVFVGGDTAWKLGPEARACVREAKRRGKYVHMGRVNSKKRIAYAKAIGCDSVDGTGWAKYRDAMMPLGLAALDQQVMETGV
jgi:hypothetical protein